VTKWLLAAALLVLIASAADPAIRPGRSLPDTSEPNGANVANTPAQRDRVPEPATMFLMGSGLLVLSSWVRRQSAQRRADVIAP
jgi:PEP-CTERM motif-containing protein